MSPRPWAEWPGRHHRGSSGVLPAPPAVALAEKSRRVDGRPEVGSPSSCETWSGCGPPAPPCPPHADGRDEPRVCTMAGRGESYRPSQEPEMKFSSPRWALRLPASLKCCLKSECII